METFAIGKSIRELPRPRKLYGRADGTIRTVEIHWYEASGVGKKEFKIKRFVD